MFRNQTTTNQPEPDRLSTESTIITTWTPHPTLFRTKNIMSSPFLKKSTSSKVKNVRRAARSNTRIGLRSTTHATTTYRHLTTKNNFVKSTTSLGLRSTTHSTTKVTKNNFVKSTTSLGWRSTTDATTTFIPVKNLIKPKKYAAVTPFILTLEQLDLIKRHYLKVVERRKRRKQIEIDLKNGHFSSTILPTTMSATTKIILPLTSTSTTKHFHDFIIDPKLLNLDLLKKTAITNYAKALRKKKRVNKGIGSTKETTVTHASSSSSSSSSTATSPPPTKTSTIRITSNISCL